MASLQNGTAGVNREFGPVQWRSLRASERRLDEAFAAMDRHLYGRQEGQNVEGEAKTYSCKHCGETLASPPILAAHVRHVHGEKRETPRRLRAKGAVNGGVPCPMCCQPLPATVGVLARQLEGEGLDDEKALRAAVICWAGLRVP